MAKPRARAGVVGRRYYGPAEEAERLGVGETLILEACRARAFPHRRLGRRILIEPDEVDAYLAATGVTLETAVARTIETAPWKRDPREAERVN